MLNTCSKFLFVGILFLCTLGAMAQPKLNAPYSRLGLGNLENQHFAHQGGFAGVGAAFASPYTVNLKNPASLSQLQYTAFEVGLYGQHSWFTTPNQTSDIWSGNLNYLSLAFPIKNPLNQILDRERSPIAWGMNVSLVPFTNVGYNIDATQQLEDGNQANLSFQGTGGTYRFIWGNGVSYKNFSFGVNMSYLFGNIENSTIITLPNQADFYADEISESFGVGGLLWDFGAQYHLLFHKVKEDGTKEYNGKYVTFGLYGGTSDNISTRSSQFIGRRNSRFPSITDTITISDNVPGDGKMPAQLGIGINTGQREKWMAGISFEATGWDNYFNESKNESLSDTWRLSLGGEITPDVRSYNNYFKKISYRGGLFAGTDPRSTANGDQISYYGATIGFGLPIVMPRQQKSFFNVALEVGKIGDADALREIYTRLTVGFTLNDNLWFYKRKFN